MILSLLWIIAICSVCSAQVTIDNYSVNSAGQVQLSIQAQANKYYTLTAQHSLTFEWITSMTMGVNGTMVISEPAAAYPEANYTITEHNIANPDDSDGDGMDDITEFNNMPTDAPLNFASPIPLIDGATSIPDAQTFTDLATVQNVGWAPFLDDQLYVKFGILDRDSPNPQVYFINSNTYIIHASFWSGIGASVTGDDSSGEIVFNPNVIRSSRGLFAGINVRQGSKEQIFNLLSEEKFSLIGTSGKAKQSFWDCEFYNKNAFVFGSEKAGLGKFWLDRVRGTIKIPMSGKADSLNLNISVACILSEHQRRSATLERS